jgi:riboflavin-specific deaminase-like protein
MLIDHGPPVIVATARRAPRERVQKLRQAGATVLQLGRDHVSLRTLLIHLHQLGIKRILLEGGGKMNWSMISNRLVDTIKLTVAPIIIGGTCATTLVDGEGVAKINQAISLTALNMRRHGNELVLSYKVK